jgi:antitoxin CptB
MTSGTVGATYPCETDAPGNGGGGASSFPEKSMSPTSHGLSRTSDGLDPRRRRVLFRAWHRGTREMDLLLGRFADANIAELAEEDLDAFERLMEVPDKDLFAWVTGAAPTPEAFAEPVLDRIVAFAERNPLTA